MFGRKPGPLSETRLRRFDIHRGEKREFATIGDRSISSDLLNDLRSLTLDPLFDSTTSDVANIISTISVRSDNLPSLSSSGGALGILLSAAQAISFENPSVEERKTIDSISFSLVKLTAKDGEAKRKFVTSPNGIEVSTRLLGTSRQAWQRRAILLLLRCVAFPEEAIPQFVAFDTFSLLLQPAFLFASCQQMRSLTIRFLSQVCKLQPSITHTVSLDQLNHLFAQANALEDPEPVDVLLRISVAFFKHARQLETSLPEHPILGRFIEAIMASKFREIRHLLFLQRCLVLAASFPSLHPFLLDIGLLDCAIFTAKQDYEHFVPLPNEALAFSEHFDLSLQVTHHRDQAGQTAFAFSDTFSDISSIPDSSLAFPTPSEHYVEETQALQTQELSMRRAHERNVDHVMTSIGAEQKSKRGSRRKKRERATPFNFPFLILRNSFSIFHFLLRNVSSVQKVVLQSVLGSVLYRFITTESNPDKRITQFLVHVLFQMCDILRESDGAALTLVQDKEENEEDDQLSVLTEGSYRDKQEQPSQLKVNMDEYFNALHSQGLFHFLAQAVLARDIDFLLKSIDALSTLPAHLLRVVCAAHAPFLVQDVCLTAHKYRDSALPSCARILSKVALFPEFHEELILHGGIPLVLAPLVSPKSLQVSPAQDRVLRSSPFDVLAHELDSLFPSSASQRTAESAESVRSSEHTASTRTTTYRRLAEPFVEDSFRGAAVLAQTPSAKVLIMQLEAHNLLIQLARKRKNSPTDVKSSSVLPEGMQTGEKECYYADLVYKQFVQHGAATVLQSLIRGVMKRGKKK